MNYGWERSSLDGFSPTDSSVASHSPGSSKKRITRVRKGCQTCRNRRVKCGEERPECHNCLRTNHVCPGYPQKKLVPSRTRDGVIIGEHEAGAMLTVIGSELVRRNREDRLPARTESTLSWSSTPVDGFFDLRLLQHFIQYSAPTLSLQGIIGRAWAQDVPQLAFGGNQEHLNNSQSSCSVCRTHQFQESNGRERTGPGPITLSQKCVVAGKHQIRRGSACPRDSGCHHVIDVV
jgi:hypothetical protein